MVVKRLQEFIEKFYSEEPRRQYVGETRGLLVRTVTAFAPEYYQTAEWTNPDLTKSPDILTRVTMDLLFKDKELDEFSRIVHSSKGIAIRADKKDV